MTSIFFVVKGDRHIAETELTKRQLSATIDAVSDNHNETYCYANMSERVKIIDWYCEDSGIAKQPELGACLWYALHNSKADR